MRVSLPLGEGVSRRLTDEGPCPTAPCRGRRPRRPTLPDFAAWVVSIFSLLVQRESGQKEKARWGNCGFAPPGADEAKAQFPQPRRFARPSLYGEGRKRQTRQGGGDFAFSPLPSPHPSNDKRGVLAPLLKYPAPVQEQKNSLLNTAVGAAISRQPSSRRSDPCGRPRMPARASGLP